MAHELFCVGMGSMPESCTAIVTMIDRNGYIYCRNHGLDRRASGVPCRKLLQREVTQLLQGQTISWSKQTVTRSIPDRRVRAESLLEELGGDRP